MHDKEQHLRESERRHDEINPACPQSQQSDHGAADRRRDKTSGSETNTFSTSALSREQRRDIGRNAEEGRMAEADQSAIADEQIETHCEDRIDQDAGELRDQKRLIEQRNRRKRDQRNDQRHERDRAHRADFPNSPSGRQTRTNAISAYNDEASSAVGNKILPKASTSPTRTRR